jgi:hypothetical protein
MLKLNKSFLLFGAMVVAFTLVCCKKPQNAPAVICKFTFNLPNKISYFGKTQDIMVSNVSTGLTKFEWYIDNNFITDKFDISSDFLKNSQVNIKHELKLVGFNNGESRVFKDSFLYKDTFAFTEISIGKISNIFFLNYVPQDTFAKIGLNLQNKFKAGGISNHIPPTNVNVLPHCWNLVDFKNNEGQFVSRKMLGASGVMGGIGDRPFFVDLKQTNDYVLQSTNFYGSYWSGANYNEISSLTLNSANHVMTIQCPLFEVRLR